MKTRQHTLGLLASCALGASLAFAGCSDAKPPEGQSNADLAGKGRSGGGGGAGDDWEWKRRHRETPHHESGGAVDAGEEPGEGPSDEPGEGTPDATPVDSAVADGGVMDAADGAVADTAVADAADSAVADTAVADTAVADTAVADTAVADTAVADTAVADTTPPPTALPCDVATVFSTHCTSCHGAGGTSPPLVTYANLTAISSAYPGQTYAMRAVTDMLSGAMPPGGGAATADITTLQNWIAASYPHGTCGSP